MATVNPSFRTDPDTQAALERARKRLVASPDSRERRVETVVASLAIIAAAALVAGMPSASPPLGAVVLLTVSYAAALRIEFEATGGYTVPTIAVLIPMLFLLPAPFVPPCVMAAGLVNFLLNVALGRRRLGRVLVVFGQAWHAVGAACVFAVFEPGAANWGDLPVVMAAFGAYVVCDALSSLAVDHFGVGENIGELIRPSAWVYFMDVLLLPIGLCVAVAANGNALAVGALAPLCLLFAIFARERRARLDHALELSQAYRGTALLLGDVVENDDDYTGSHSREVVDLAVSVGERLGLDAAQRRNLEFGALLHDVGKIAVPKEILHKPGRLTVDEWQVMRRHTVDGQRMLEGVGGVLAEVGRIVRSSHEHYDGRGYPDGLVGEAIPIEARICVACDAFSAMTTDRPYRQALTLNAALRELEGNAGTQFDPSVVAVLVAIVGRVGTHRSA